MSFTADLQRFAQRTLSRLDEADRAIKIELFNGAIRDTRVRTGRLRGNWQTSTGAPASGQLSRTQPGQQGVATSEVASNVTAFSKTYLTNNLPYARIWEERDGMIIRNLTRIERTVREVIGRVR